MSLESADSHDSDVLRETIESWEKSWKTRYLLFVTSPFFINRFHVLRQIYFPLQILFIVNDDLSWRTKRDNVRNIYWIPIKNGSGCGPSSAQKKQPTFLHIKHDYPYIFQKLILFSLHNVSRKLSCRSRYSFILAAIRVSFENMSMKEYLDLQDSSLFTLWSEKRIIFWKI